MGRCVRSVTEAYRSLEKRGKGKGILRGIQGIKVFLTIFSANMSGKLVDFSGYFLGNGVIFGGVRVFVAWRLGRAFAL